MNVWMYLAEWPVGRLARPNMPVNYRLDEESGDAIVWSVGPNGINDGGTIDLPWGDPRLDTGVRIRRPNAEE